MGQTPNPDTDPVLEPPSEAGDPNAPPDGPQTPGEACAAEVGEGNSVPPVIQFVVDISGSMNWAPGTDESPPAGVPSKWETTLNALITSLQAMPPETPVGMFVYPGPQQRFARSCVREDAGQPIAELTPDHLQAIEDVLRDIDPSEGTPTHDAFLAGQQRLSVAEFPGEKYLVLITDGTPTVALGCDILGRGEVAPTQPIIDAAAAARAANIGTFVIGSPGSEPVRADLSAIAQQGGTGSPTCTPAGPEFCHFDMTAQPDFGAALATALQEITERTISCSYAVPTPPSGQSIDPERINVRLTTSSGEVVDILKDPSATECNGGWQFANGGSTIQLCEDTCNRAKSDSLGAKIDILFGCNTKVR